MKKGALLLIFVLLAFGLYGLWRYSQTPKSDPSPTLSVSNQDLKLAEADSDGDGLLDWEEALWASNPNKADTDGDGTPDGQEVNTNRNPTVAGPNDVVQQKLTQASSSNAYSYTYDPTLGETLTDKVSINLVANYLEAKASNSYNAETANEISSQTLAQMAEVKIYRDVTLGSMRLVSNDPKEIESYGTKISALMLVLTNNRFAEAGISAQIMQGTVSGNTLSPYIDKYSMLRDTLVGMRVPERFGAVHLTAAQDLDTITRSLTDLAKLESDPLAAMLELTRYGLAVEELGKTYESGSRLAIRETL